MLRASVLAVLLWLAPPARADALVSPPGVACRELAAYVARPLNSPTDGLVILKDDAVAFEHYGNGFGPDRVHGLFSVTKTVTGLLLGVAVREGRVSLEQRLSEYYPSDGHEGAQREAYETIRLSNLFYMDTGFVWSEHPPASDFAGSQLMSMLFGGGREDMAAFVASRPVIAQGAGHRWQYSTGTPTLAMGVLKKAYGAESARFPWRELFDPLGMKSAAFERDVSGTFVGGGYAHATPRDLAKLGTLLLRGGRWNGEQLLPEDWVDRMRTPSPGFLSPGTTVERIARGGNLVYGGSIWLNVEPRPGMHRPFASSPADMFLALGHGGQVLAVLPSHGLVIARTGGGGEYDTAIDGLVTRAIACLSDPTVAPAAPLAHFLDEKPMGKRQVLALIRSGLRSGALQRAVAKGYCSCRAVWGLGPRVCGWRTGFPYVPAVFRFREVGQGVEARPVAWAAALAGTRARASARFEGSPLGCGLD